MASIQIYFEGAKFFHHREGDEARSRSEGPRAGAWQGATDQKRLKTTAVKRKEFYNLDSTTRLS